MAGFYTKIIHMERKPVKRINECQHDSDTNVTTSWVWKENKAVFCGQKVLFFPFAKKNEKPRPDVWNLSYTFEVRECTENL